MIQIGQRLLLAAFVSVALVPSLEAQGVAQMEPAPAQSYPFELSIQNIMRGTELVGEAPQAVRWSDDGQWIYFRWRPGGGAWSDSRDWYRVASTGGEPQQLSEVEAEENLVRFSGGDISPDRAWRVTTVDQDLYLVDRESDQIRRLTYTADAERNPSFSGDAESIFFRRGDNLFALSLNEGAVRQLTDLRPGPAPDQDDEAEGQEEFLEDQQESLFENIRLKRARDEEEEAREERAEARRPAPFYRARRERVAGLHPTPTGDFAAVVLSTPPADSKSTIVPDWVTESGYTEDLVVRTKVGDEQNSLRIGIVQTTTGEMTLLDVTGTSSTAEGAEPGTAEPDEKAEDPDLAAITFGGWNESGTLGIVFAVDYDYKNWRLYSVEAATGDLTLLDTLHDEAWVGGPCFPGPRLGAGGQSACLGWVPGQDRIYYVSEETGWAHIYAIDPDGTDKEALTSGDWEVHNIQMPEDRSHFLLTTGQVSVFDRHAVRMDLDGSNRELLYQGDGRFAATLSPDQDRVAVVRSSANRPAELYLADYRVGADLDQVTHSPTDEWLSYPWIQPEIVHVPASDGIDVPARIYRPSDVGVPANGAGVIFVHGAGYTQNVHNGWSGYYREFMFHHYLASLGYTVLDIDYRGSAGYGRDWRTAVYRWMGGADLSDQVDGARYLADSEGVDPSRIGLYGGSYGGFITLMALFTEPDVFRAGGALRSVTDWAHYNHGYTSRILNEPQDDEEAYEKSSPIYFAEGLEGDLLIAHGMVDTNVHFSDVVRLAQRLIELGKENWEMAVYPVESHGFQEPTSWTDEYRRIFELFDRTIGTGLTTQTRTDGSPQGRDGPDR